MSWTHTRSRIALFRKAHPDQPVPAELYQQLKAERLADHVQAVLASPPPLTDEARAEIASLLRPTSGTAA